MRASVILIASARGNRADEIAGRLRRDGVVVLTAHSFEGCLRVATSVGPDLVVLDNDLPPRLEKLLHAHPVSERARIVHLHGSAVPVGLPAAASLAI